MSVYDFKVKRANGDVIWIGNTFLDKFSEE